MGDRKSSNQTRRTNGAIPTLIHASCGEVRNVNGEWFFRLTDGDENLVEIPFTDHWTVDTFILRHEGKCGIFSLPDLGDYGNDGTLEWRGLDDEPFPYDELKVWGMDRDSYGMISCRKGAKWGVMIFFFVTSEDCVRKYDIVPYQYSSMEEALKHLPKWRNPFEGKHSIDDPTVSVQQLKKEKVDYRRINHEVMTDTKKQYETAAELSEAVNHSIAHQYMVSQEENIGQPKAKNCNTQFVCSGKRSFEAAKGYKGKKVAVLNFANNHSVGGAPFSAVAQEESLCRCSTLFPCLKAMSVPFYKKHIRQYGNGEIGAMGNDDLIYTPDVVVFKTDERTDPVYPKMMESNDWYKVDVITCAAPEMMKMRNRPADYEEVINRRIKKILDVAAKENVEVLILGAWGCGAFENDTFIVAKTFHSLLHNYNFEVVEFALASRNDVSSSPFANCIHQQG